MDTRRVESLQGQEVSAVSFVRDYVEFHFDGPVLRALTRPVVEAGGQRYHFPDAGSRDALCGLIGTQVQRVVFQPHALIQLEMADGRRLTIPLDAASYIGPEAAHFIPADGILQVYD